MRSLPLASAALAALSLHAQPARFEWPGGARAAVVLSYDDGIDIDLDHVGPDLDAAGLKGTFFVTGDSSSVRSRLEAWRSLARRGHELANHTLFHPCLRWVDGRERDFVIPERNLENYTVSRMAGEVRMMNLVLGLLDGLPAHTFAYTCGDQTAGGISYVDAIRGLVPAARAYKNDFRALADPVQVDPYRVPSWAIKDNTATEMIAWVEQAVASGSLAVFTFHGVGGGHHINVDRQEHARLLAWLGAHRQQVWTAPFRTVMEHVAAERKRLSGSEGRESGKLSR